MDKMLPYRMNEGLFFHKLDDNGTIHQFKIDRTQAVSHRNKFFAFHVPLPFLFSSLFSPFLFFAFICYISVLLKLTWQHHRGIRLKSPLLSAALYIYQSFVLTIISLFFFSFSLHFSTIDIVNDYRTTCDVRMPCYANSLRNGICNKIEFQRKLAIKMTEKIDPNNLS